MLDIFDHLLPNKLLNENMLIKYLLDFIYDGAYFLTHLLVHLLMVSIFDSFRAEWEQYVPDNSLRSTLKHDGIQDQKYGDQEYQVGILLLLNPKVNKESENNTKHQWKESVAYDLDTNLIVDPNRYLNISDILKSKLEVSTSSLAITAWLSWANLILMICKLY